MDILRFEFLNAPNQWVGAVLALSALTLLSVYLFVYRGRGQLDRSLNKTMIKLGKKTVKDALIPDDDEGIIAVDYMVLMPGGILLFYLMNMPGNIYGAMRMDQWTQLVGSKSVHFENPLYALGEAVRVVRSFLPGVHVEGKVVFLQSAHFPKGKPENVCRVDSLPDEISKLYKPGNKFELNEAWEKLVAIVDETRTHGHLQPKITRFDRV